MLLYSWVRGSEGEGSPLRQFGTLISLSLPARGVKWSAVCENKTDLLTGLWLISGLVWGWGRQHLHHHLGFT